jgi:hypothetical protein
VLDESAGGRAPGGVGYRGGEMLDLFGVRHLRDRLTTLEEEYRALRREWADREEMFLRLYGRIKQRALREAVQEDQTLMPSVDARPAVSADDINARIRAARRGGRP